MHGCSQERRIRDSPPTLASFGSLEALKLCLVDWGGLKRSRWQTVPAGPGEGGERLVLGAGAGNVSGALDFPSGWAVGGERGSWQGSLLSAPSSTIISTSFDVESEGRNEQTEGMLGAQAALGYSSDGGGLFVGRHGHPWWLRKLAERE